MGYKGLPVYEFKIDKKKKEDGIKLISIVDRPAMESSFYMFSSEERQKYVFVDEPQGMIAGLAVIPNKYIYRENSDGEQFYGIFRPETIVELRDKFMKEKNIDKVNFQHVEQAVAEDIYMVESYIVKTENQQKDLEKMGITAPIGSWFVQYKCENLDTWKQIKEFGFKGFSIEAFLEQELIELNKIQNKNQNIMSKIIDKFKAVLAELEKEELVDRIAETGQAIMVGKEGEPVTLTVVSPTGEETETPCPDGTYVLESGDQIEVKNGMLVTRVAKTEQAVPEEKPEEEKPAEEKPIQPPASGDTAMADYPWETCVADRLAEGYDQESAEAICGKIKSENMTSEQAAQALGCKKKEEMAEMPIPSGDTAQPEAAPEPVDVTKKTLGELVDVSKDGMYEISVTVMGGEITEATVEAVQELVKTTLAAKDAEIVALKAQLKLPITKPVVNQKETQKVDMSKMSPYERTALARGFKIIK